MLLTGATGGLGQAIARDLARRGARLTLSGRREEALQALAAELGAAALAADLSDAEAPARLATGAGAVDILIANAGLPAAGHLESFTLEQIDRALQVNLRAPILLARELLPPMRGRGRGHLLFMSSLAGKASTPRTAIYGATKFGLRGFATALRADLRGSGVGVSVLLPGFVAEAGMYADAGAAKLPPGARAISINSLTEAVAGAIEHDRGEVVLAPPLLRVGAFMAQNAPELAMSLGRLLGSERIAREMDAGEREKR